MTARRPAPGEPFGDPVPLDPTGALGDLRLGTIAADGLSVVGVRPVAGDALWTAARRSPADPFGRPVSLGPAVNGRSVDTCPAVSADGRTVLFCSTRPGGFGDFDIWQTRRVARGP